MKKVVVLLILSMLYMSPTFGYPPEYPYYQSDNIMYYVFESEKTANVVTYYMEFRVGWRPFIYRDAVTIPETITYNRQVFRVTSFSSSYPDYYSCVSKITSLELPNTLSSLGSLAYSRIKSIDLPEALLGISDYGFYGCYSLRDLVIPDKVKTIGNYAFANCIGLTHVHLGKSVETIGENVFLNSDSLTSITVDEENPYFMVEDGVLYSKDKRELLYCPKNFSGIYRVAEEVKRIGKSAFRNCNQLTEIVLPEGLEVIGDTAFYGCTQLKQISLPKSVSQIGAYAYKGCPLQGTLDLMNIKDIGEGAFEGCTGLTSVVLPENLLRIEASLFQGCTGLTVVNIPQCVTAIGTSAFASCSRLQSVSIPDEVERIEDYAFKGCSNMKHLAIGNSVKKIGVEAFGECRRLKSLSIPASVDSILSSFVDCDSVSSLELKDGNRPILIEGKCFNGGNMMIDTLYIGRKISGVPQFNECAYLSTLTVGSMILTMQDVSGCKNLSKVICLGATPPEATMTTFSTVTLDGTLVVPASAEEVYRRTAPWRFFYTIETFPDVAPTKLILDTESYQITREDEALSLLATVYPEHATFSGLRWTSSNEMVATVSETGIVHSNKEGEADITVSLNDGALTATCHVSVHYVDAVEEHEADQVSIYPNPVDDMLHIDGVTTGTSITLYDMTGRLVLSDRAYGGAMTFDMSALKRGVYLCRIQNKTYKIVKR